MASLPLHSLHTERGARLGADLGQECVLDYGSPVDEYRMLRQQVVLVDLSHRGRLCLMGADRGRLLHGQVTNDVLGLKSGEGCQAALVTAKGRFEADLAIHVLPDEILMEFDPGLTESLTQRFDHYIVADDVQVVDVAPHFALFTLQGPKSADVLQTLREGDPVSTREFQVTDWSHPEWGELYVMRRNRCGELGYDIYVPMEVVTSVWEALVQSTRQVGGGPAGWTALDWRRVEAGIPRFGVDLDATHLAPEAGAEYVRRAINYGKGCYIGQEVIARIRTYGQVTKSLQGLWLPTGMDTLPKRGEKLLVDGRERGYITSAIYSPTCQRSIALGFVRKEYNRVGSQLLRADHPEQGPVTVASLPFVPTEAPV